MKVIKIMDRRLPSRKWGPWREEWYSICSMHYFHNEKCKLCTDGIWVNTWKASIEEIVYKIAPNLWSWWANKWIM